MSALPVCSFCKKELQPHEVHRLHVKGRLLFTACPKHRDKVAEAVRTSALFTRGAVVAGAKHYLDKKAPGLFDGLAGLVATYREMTDPTEK